PSTSTQPVQRISGAAAPTRVGAGSTSSNHGNETAGPPAVSMPKSHAIRCPPYATAPVARSADSEASPIRIHGSPGRYGVGTPAPILFIPSPGSSAANAAAQSVARAAPPAASEGLHVV